MVNDELFENCPCLQEREHHQFRSRLWPEDHHSRGARQLKYLRMCCQALLFHVEYNIYSWSMAVSDEGVFVSSNRLICMVNVG